mmetsp:Transcript_5376/g.17301  ORF Transcript_5376/g.17301 Transcript_5376/m.17301 type:complete len:293 (+) Transcript_5376:1656-2534(+)
MRARAAPIPLPAAGKTRAAGRGGWGHARGVVRQAARLCRPDRPGGDRRRAQPRAAPVRAVRAGGGQLRRRRRRVRVPHPGLHALRGGGGRAERQAGGPLPPLGRAAAHDVLLRRAVRDARALRHAVRRHAAQEARPGARRRKGVLCLLAARGALAPPQRAACARVPAARAQDRRRLQAVGDARPALRRDPRRVLVALRAGQRPRHTGVHLVADAAHRPARRRVAQRLAGRFGRAGRAGPCRALRRHEEAHQRQGARRVAKVRRAAALSRDAGLCCHGPHGQLRALDGAPSRP